MDRRETYQNEEQTLRLLLRGHQSKIWTALPGIVDKFDAARMTVNVQPTISGRIRQVDGAMKSVQMPLLMDCPVVWQGGGGALMTFPIKKGDECLVVFASRCIDTWWSRGASNAPEKPERLEPPSWRMHDLSDGFALVGVRSLPRALAADLAAAQLRSDDGSVVVSLNPTTQQLTLTAPGGVVINGDVTLNGAMVATGNVTGQGTSLHTHTHSDPQGGSTGVPA